MRPTLLTVRGVRVPSYPAMLWLGIVLGVVVQNAAAHDAGIAADRVWIATLVLLPLALVGARLLHVAGHWHLYRHDLPRVVDRSSGGMAMYGGIIVMLPASLVVLALLDVPYWQFWDVTILLILPAMVFTARRVPPQRVLRREGDRRVVRRPPCGATTAPSTRRVPTQLLEACLAAALLAVAVAVRPVVDRPGQLFLLVAAGYGIGRTLLQSLRGMRTRVDGLLLLSVAIAALAAAGLVLVP